jgi:Family of unknown function (DUF5335)
MATRIIDRKEWRTFFDSVSKGLVGKRVEIEAASLDLGDQIVAEWLPVIGITYDSKDDLLDVAVTGLDHLVRAPQEIAVEEGKQGIETIAVVDGDSTKQILRFKDPLTLPA